MAIDISKNYDLIVSIATHGKRIKNLLTIIPLLLMEYNYKIHIIVNIYKADYSYITPDIFKFIETGKIELFVSPINICGHLKYYYTILRYKNIPILTLDDDIIYPSNIIDIFMSNSKKYPNAILSRNTKKINIYNNILPYITWKDIVSDTYQSKYLFNVGCGGVFYPKNAFNRNTIFLNEILGSKYNDDVYLKILQIRNKINILHICNNCTIDTLDYINDQDTIKCSLSNNYTLKEDILTGIGQKTFFERTDLYIQMFKNEILNE